jgi:P-type E1-E2 ATPase
LIAEAINAKPGRSSTANLFDIIREHLGKFFGLTVGTPLQRKLSQLFIWLFVCAVLCAIIVLGANKFQSRGDVVIYAVTTAVGTIPVSLLLVLTVTMAAGTKKMLERYVMVRNLSSLEALVVSQVRYVGIPARITLT